MQPFALYRGVLPPALGAFVQNAVLFETYDRGLRWLAPVAAPAALPWLAGAIGGLACCVITTPMELLKCRMQVDTRARSYGPLGEARATLQFVRMALATDGLPGLFRGWWMTVFRDVPSYAVYYGAYDGARRIVTRSGRSWSWHHQLVGGGIAGILSWICVYPVDVIKSRVQIASGSLRLHDVWLTAMRTVRTDGVQWMFSGIGATVVRAFPVNAVTFYVWELLRTALQRA